MSAVQHEWLKWLLKQGFVAVALSAVLWFAGYKMVLPVQNVAMESMKENSAALSKMAEAWERQTELLRRIDRNTSK